MTLVALDEMVNHVEALKDKKILLWGSKIKIALFGHLVDYLYSMALEHLALSASHMCKK